MLNLQCSPKAYAVRSELRITPTPCTRAFNPDHIAKPFPKLVHRYKDSTSRRFAGVISRAWPWPLICANVEIITLRKFLCTPISTILVEEATKSAYLVLRVECYNSRFVRSHNGLTSSNHPIIGLGRQLISQEKKNKASLQEILCKH
jgi:hypothetical protein